MTQVKNVAAQGGFCCCSGENGQCYGNQCEGAQRPVILEMERAAARRRGEIRATPDSVQVAGKCYYVNNNGCDDSDGLTPETAWRTLQRVTQAALQPGDGVLFRRGDVFRGCVEAKPGVTYAAYGEGEKPVFYSWDDPLNDPALWELADEAHHIWKLRQKILDVGTLVFDGGAAHSRKLIPSYINGRFVCREDESRPFDMGAEMTQDLDVYWHFEGIMSTKPSKGQDFPVPDLTAESFGELYLRCDRGNPGQVFGEIEALARRHMFLVRGDGVRIDNLCLKYIGMHAVSGGGICLKGLHVTNCEIGWIGGCIQHYYGTDPNYPQGGRGTVTRFGNGVEIYGGCSDYLVENCWIYQVYDAGITHQITTNGRTVTMEHIRYRRNLVEHCVYGIEYFLDMTGGDTDSIMRDVEMTGNILRLSGYGWGQQRHNTDTPALIKGWSYVNNAEEHRIWGNVFDRCAYRLLHLVAREQKSCPELRANTYIQYAGGMLGQYGENRLAEPPVLPFDGNAAATLGDSEGRTFVV